MQYSLDKLNKYIKDKEPTDGEFASKIPIHPNYLSQILNGHKPITKELIRKIKNVEEYSDVEDFLLGINEPESQYNKEKNLNLTFHELTDLFHELNTTMVKILSKLNQMQKFI
jgi:plasmid maintenance system antidote protein VapI